MPTVTGKVEKILGKAAGRGFAYNFVIDGVWYGNGFDKPKFREQDTITFDYTENGQWKNVNAKSVKIVPAQAAAATSSGGGGYAKSSDTQLAIQYQASRNAAIAFTEMCLTAGAVALPTKKGEQFDALLALVEDVTIQFHAKTDQVIANGGVILNELESAYATSGDDF